MKVKLEFTRNEIWLLYIALTTAQISMDKQSEAFELAARLEAYLHSE